MTWEADDEKKLFYHISRICRVLKEEKKANYDPKAVVKGLSLLLSDKYPIDKVIQASKEIIRLKRRIPLSLEIERYIETNLYERDKS